MFSSSVACVLLFIDVCCCLLLGSDTPKEEEGQQEHTHLKKKPNNNTHTIIRTTELPVSENSRIPGGHQKRLFFSAPASNHFFPEWHAFATDALGDPNRRISQMVATDSIHGSFLLLCGKATRWADRSCDAEFFQNYIRIQAMVMWQTL